ncbi:MAG: protoheme IX farnesyltransferase [Phycisphaerae bacterium]|jgi:protoheme IX farnesyltransferase|nr:protoheme IX farnesyltransferase [Phycisphaerae bacterium]
MATSAPTPLPPSAPSSVAINEGEPIEAEHRETGLVGLVIELTKARLNGLVLITTGVGYLLAGLGAIDWMRLAWTMVGTALAAASAAMLNQLAERHRDALMHRTARRPLPQKRVPAPLVFVAGVLSAFAGFAILALFVNLLSGTLALANVVLYVIVYTPLKPRTTLNTLIGAVCGGIPPMIGWAAVTGGLEPGAWLLGILLFVWQMPHFMALAWMYRDDYRRGGMTMLPVVDPQGELTGRVMVVTSLLLAPLGMSATLGGLCGWVSAAINLLTALAMTWMSYRFYVERTDLAARKAFFASIIYLPIALAAMVVDRGPVSAEAWLHGGRDPYGETRRLELPPSPVPAAPSLVNPGNGP